MSKFSQLNPQPLFNYFEAICDVPRASKKEEKIRRFLLDFAAINNLDAKTDEVGNVLILKPATLGMEKSPTVILQTHMDMVCEKNSEVDFDFDNDAINPRVIDGWVKANGTTLGADCGIGMAAQLAVLNSVEIKHGTIECFFTVDEESGMSGAFGLKPGFLSGTVLLNLDSEDEGEIFIGCAGGVDTLATFIFETEVMPKDFVAVKVSVTGLLGGHSGDDINKNRGNANKILNRFLLSTSIKQKIKIADFNGGNLRNAIAREAFAVVAVRENEKERLFSELENYAKLMGSDWQHTEPELKITIEETGSPNFVINCETQNKLMRAICACPHGVMGMSSQMDGMVETSTNLASVKFIESNKILITTSQRSDIESRKNQVAEMVKSVFKLAGAEVTHSDGYPGWTPNSGSPILKTTVDSYKKLFGVEPVVRSIHAGLECGLFLEKYPDLDMVSFGPTILGAHSPNERLNIETTGKFWLHLVDVLENIK
jgi:dipeptidase D